MMQSWIARCAVVVAFALFCSRAALAGGPPGWIPTASSATDFSATQGQGGWSYCYATTSEMGAPVTPMAYFIPNGAACGCGNLAALWSYAQAVCFCGQQFCFISPTITHINTQGATQIPVRRYQLPATGRFALTATFSHGGGCTGTERIRLELRFRNSVLWSAESGPAEQSGTVEVLGEAGEFVDLVSVPLGGQCGGAHVARLDVASGDCNGNGVADTTDIANYDLLDLDTDGVPDCCTSGGDCASKGAILVVSQSGGEFTTIQAAYDAAVDGDTVLVLPGTYTNPDGLVLNAGGKAVRVVSRDGPASVILDAEGRSGVMIVGAHPLQVIEGLTIANSVGTACGASGSVIRNCTFRDNSGNWGGAVFSAIYAQPRFENCTFLRNTAVRGGAVFAHQDFAVMTFVGCTFDLNSSPEGGALHIRDGASLVLENCRFAKNTSSGTGGAAFVWFSGQTVRDCVFEDNTANSSGAFFAGPGSFERTIFRNNSAIGAGAVAGHLQTFTDCLFESNTSAGAGGAMYAWCFGPTLTRCTFRNNTAGGAGAIFAGGCEMQMTAIDCLFEGNRAETTEPSPGAGYYAGMGGAIRMDGTHLSATRCTFRGNFATYAGGATNRWYGSMTLNDCVYRDNVAMGFGGADFSIAGAAPGTIATNTDACDNFPNDFGGQWNNASGNSVEDHCVSGLTELAQWNSNDGGNGHVYGILAFDEGTCWTAAKVLATRTGGSLASITSEAEAIFVFGQFASRAAFWTRSLSGGQNVGPYIGAKFNGKSWRWDDDSAFSYERFVPGVPAGASVAMFLNPTGAGSSPAANAWGWTTDCPSSLRPNSAVVEFSADCNANGIIDVLETTSGAVPDINRNNVPDTCECIGDIYANGVIDGGDLGVLLSEWGLSGPTIASDLDGDGFVNGADLTILLSSWGPCSN